MTAIAPTTSRRACLAGAFAAATVLATGCAAPKPAPAPTLSPQELRARQLQSIGFVRSSQGWEFSLEGRLLFEHDSDALDPETQTIAARLGQQLAQLGVQRMRVEGHTDNVGSDAYNQALSLRRALAVARAMMDAGLAAEIEVVGMGKSAPVADNRDPGMRRQNRRVAVVIPAQ